MKVDGDAEMTVKVGKKIVDPDPDRFLTLEQFARPQSLLAGNFVATSRLDADFYFDTAAGGVQFSGIFNGSLRNGVSRFSEKINLPNFDDVAEDALGLLGKGLSKIDLGKVRFMDTELPIIEKTPRELIGREMQKAIGIDPTEIIMDSDVRKSRRMAQLIRGVDFDLFSFGVNDKYSILDAHLFSKQFDPIDFPLLGGVQFGIEVNATVEAYIKIDGAYSVLAGPWVTPQSSAGLRAKIGGGFFGKVDVLGLGALEARGGAYFNAVAGIHVIDSTPNDGKVFLANIQDVGVRAVLAGEAELKGCVSVLGKEFCEEVWGERWVLVDESVGPAPQIMMTDNVAAIAANGTTDPISAAYFAKLRESVRDLDDARERLSNARKNVAERETQLEDLKAAAISARTAVDLAQQNLATRVQSVEYLVDRLVKNGDWIEEVRRELSGAPKNQKGALRSKLDDLLSNRSGIELDLDAARVNRKAARHELDNAEAANEIAKAARSHAKQRLDDAADRLERRREELAEARKALNQLLGLDE